MSRVASILKRAGRLPTLGRTLRHLRADQARAQLKHLLIGLPAPVRLEEAAPTLAVTAARCDFLPPPAHVRSLGDSRIELLARSFDLERETDWDSTRHGPLFAYHLHQHDYLRLYAFTPRSRALRMVDWTRRHRSGVGWDPHPISLRLLVWGKLLLSPAALALEAAERETLLSSMADQAETLRRGIEVRLQANHLLSNRIALVWAGLLLDHSRSQAWLDQATPLMREIEAQIHPDGGHEERSPMYHALLLESLLDLLNLACATPDRAPAGLVESLRGTATRMLAALEAWTHPDGRIALFGDSGFDIAAEPLALRQYAECLDVAIPFDGAPGSSASSELPQTGHARLRRGRATLIASLSGPAPAHQPGHAHCDALAFELSFDETRCVTDTGLYEYEVGPRRQRARATTSHATIAIDGEEQAEIWSAHRVGGRPVVDRLGGNGVDRVEARCRPWSRPRTVHRRLFLLDSEGVTILDHIEGACRSVRFVLPFDPVWSLELRPDGRGAVAHRPEASRLRTAGPSRVELALFEGLAWRIEQGPYYPSFGREVDRAILIGEGSPFVEARTRIVPVD